MTIKKTLRMVRSGEFDIHTYGENHCGTADEFKVRYHLVCDCSPKLDKRGFLFDQLNIQSFFESIGRTKFSCEQLTVKCLEQLLSNILAENPSCQIYRMELTLSPEPFMASMTHTWENARPMKQATPSKRRKQLKQIADEIKEAADVSRLSNLKQIQFAFKHNLSYKFQET